MLVGPIRRWSHRNSGLLVEVVGVFNEKSLEEVCSKTCRAPTFSKHFAVMLLASRSSVAYWSQVE